MDDDFVAEVLAKEARENSQKYSAEGLSAYMPRKLVLVSEGRLQFQPRIHANLTRLQARRQCSQA